MFTILHDTPVGQLGSFGKVLNPKLRLFLYEFLMTPFIDNDIFMRFFLFGSWMSFEISKVSQLPHIPWRMY